MADFSKSIAVVLAHEGGYVSDPQDPGGETLYGIARNDFPTWPGWASVDTYKRNAPDFRSAIMRDAKLLQAAKDGDVVAARAALDGGAAIESKDERARAQRLRAWRRTRAWGRRAAVRRR